MSAETSQELVRENAQIAMDHISYAICYGREVYNAAENDYQRRKAVQQISTLNRASLVIHGLLSYKPRGPQAKKQKGQ